MCGRFDLHLPREIIAEIFGISILQDIQPRYNIAPTQQVAVIRTYPDGTKHLDLLKWGLIPSWAKDPHIGSKMINARSETIEVKPAFRTAVKHRRSIIPANGFYEWQEVGGRKHPLYVKLKDNSPMMFAGLWDHWKSPGGEVVETCTILTTSANDLINHIHDRMPVILDPKNIELWLDLEITDSEHLKPLFKPYPSDLIEIYPVSNLVNTPRNDIPECIKPMKS